MQLALLTLTDKPYGGSQVSLRRGALDSLEMARMAFGDAEALAREPRLYTVVNVNSPLLYDERMLDALLALRGRRPARDRHAVPADGRDVAGLDPVGARAADGRGAGRASR